VVLVVSTLSGSFQGSRFLDLDRDSVLRHCKCTYPEERGELVKPKEAAAQIRELTEEREDREQEAGLRRRMSLLIAVLAALLAIAALLVHVTTKNEINENVHAADFRSSLEATSSRLTATLLAQNDLQDRLADPSIAPAVRTLLQQRLDGYKAAVVLMQSNPQAGDGIKEYSERVQTAEQDQKRFESRAEYYDLAEVLFEIAIVVASVAILAVSRTMLGVSLTVSVVAALLLLNGAVLLVH